jgi:hypothetical protein
MPPYFGPQFSAGGVTEVFVLDHDREPIGTAVDVFSVGGITACDDLFTIKLAVA